MRLRRPDARGGRRILRPVHRRTHLLIMLTLLTLLATCAKRRPHDPRPRPARSAASSVHDSIWGAACDLPRASRYGRFFELADEQTTEAIRRLVHHCGPEREIAITSDLCAFQTVAAIGPPSRSKAFLDMAEYLERWAKEMALEFHVVGDHDAWEIVLPGDVSDPRSLVFLTHGDVVPVNDPPTIVGADTIPTGWTVPAFAVSERDGKLYGRGTEDDKGPIASAMVVMAALREADVQFDGDVVLVIGTGEEHDWEGMKRYAKRAPAALHVLSLDAAYPVVTAESGFVAWGLRVPMAESAPGSTRPVAIDVRGGLFLTQIPDRAELVLRPHGQDAAALSERARLAAKEELSARRTTDPDSPFRIEVHLRKAEQGELVAIEVHGRSSHSSKPGAGHNALWVLSAMAQRLDVAPGGIRTMLDVIAKGFDGEHHGERLGLAYEDEMMGPLLVAPTKLRVEGGEIVLSVNMRRPRGRSHDAFSASLDALLARLQSEHGPELRAVDEPHIGDAHVVDENSALPQILLSVYRETTGKVDEEPVAIAGGTYARLFEGAVSFGPSFPGRPYRGHGADEYIELDALTLGTELLLEAVFELSPARSGSDAVGETH